MCYTLSMSSTKEYHRDYSAEWRKNNKEKYNAYSAEYQKRKTIELRQQIEDYFGNCCAVCGFDNPLALEIDHIEGGGGAWRKGKGPLRQWRDIIKSGYVGVQLLCANCHAIKTRTR